MRLTIQCRSTRDFFLFLPIHTPHLLLIMPRLWSNSTRIWSIPILHSCARRPYICSMRMPSHKWLCWISALRRWNSSICLAPPRCIFCYVCHHVLGVDCNIQIVGWLRTNTHRRPVCGAVHHLGHMLTRLCDYASHTCRQYAPRSLAPWRSHLWHLLSCGWSGYTIRLLRHNLRCRSALLGWALLCNYLQPTGCHDGL